MTKLNITQAAKAVGVSRKTMQRHIRLGKVSCEVDSKGHKLIDVSELVRVYGELKTDDSPSPVTQAGQKTQYDMSNVAPIFERQIRNLEEQVEELRKDKERLLGIVEQQTLMLTNQPERKGFWKRVFGT